jgi:hypothetical protein
MEKALIIVFDSHTSEDSIEMCIKILKCFRPLIHILSPVDRHAITRLASNEGIKETDARERALHEAYENLYHLEDIFNRHNMHVTGKTKEMRLPEELVAEIRKTNPGMLVVIGRLDPVVLETLYGSFHVPVLLLVPEE